MGPDMAIDPVVALCEALDSVEREMGAACRQNAVSYRRERAERINGLLQEVKARHAEILVTAPTSAQGASILIRIAATRLPPAQFRHSEALYRVADRLELGLRRHDDLVWLRALADQLRRGGGKDGELGALLARAACGMARPVIVHSSPPACRPPDRQGFARPR